MIAEKDFAGRQHIGRRKRQEDAYAFADIPDAEGASEGLLVVITDGMGGHTSGEQASELALESFVDAVQLAEGPLSARLKTAIVASNQAIADALKEAPDLQGMGTTLLAAAATPGGVEWLSVGDSPLFIWRAGMLTRLNADHSFRPMLLDMVESGEINHDDALKHPLKNLLRAALTGRRIDMIDQPAAPIPLAPGDILLAATDGIQTLPDEHVGTLITEVAHNEASAIADVLLQAVLDIRYPKQDNVTIAVIKVEQGELAEGRASHGRHDVSGE